MAQRLKHEHTPPRVQSCMITYGSLFTGVGGFDLGCDAAGWQNIWQVEFDKHCQQVLRKHWPDSDLRSDVKEQNGGELTPVDVITFGFPCQDLSIAGKRAGLDGQRSGLFFEAIRIINEMRAATNGIFPRVVVAENVTGLLNADKGAAMGRCLNALAEAGALVIEWRVLDAQFFGVPQRRRRVFIVAVFDPRAAGCEQIFPFPTSVRGDSATSDEKREETARGAARGATRSERVVTGTVTTTWAKGPGNTQVEEGHIQPTPDGPRRITPRECERLQGWPDDHTRYMADGKEVSDSARYRMAGNGVAAPVAHYVATCITNALNTEGDNQ